MDIILIKAIYLIRLIVSHTLTLDSEITGNFSFFFLAFFYILSYIYYFGRKTMGEALKKSLHMVK